MKLSWPFKWKLSIDTYFGALCFNLLAAFIPALYATLAKLWLASIDSLSVVTSDSYTYLSNVAEVLNEGLPRAAFLIIGDHANRKLHERVRLSSTLLTFQMIASFILSVIFFITPHQFASAFMPPEVQQNSITYIKISAFSTFFTATSYAVTTSSRSFDRPDIPLLISISKTILNILLDGVFLSNRHPKSYPPTVNTQASIRLACDAIGAISGLLYFIIVAHIELKNFEKNKKVDSDDESSGVDMILEDQAIIPSVSQSTEQLNREPSEDNDNNNNGNNNDNYSAKPSLESLKVLVKAGSFTFLESLVRNALYLWLVSGIVQLGTDYATAWGVFNTIRWGLVMTPVNALEPTSSTFTGHRFSEWNKNGRHRSKFWKVAKPAALSSVIALTVEIVICIVLSVWLVHPFSFYLSGSTSVSDITTMMWKSIDWCYIFYALYTTFASFLLATSTRWYFANNLISNLIWVLPWAIAVPNLHITENSAWKYYSVIFGGSLVVSFFVVVATIAVWIYVQLFKNSSDQIKHQMNIK